MVNEFEYLKKKILATVESRIVLPPFQNESLSNVPLSVPYLLARVFENWRDVGISRQDFQAELDRFNVARKASLKDVDFENINWIREINGRIVLPNAIWSLVHTHSKRITNEQSAEKFLCKEFLATILGRFNVDKQVIISQAGLEVAIDNMPSKYRSEAIQTLTNKGLLVFNSAENNYSFNSQNYDGVETDELAARLWKSSVGQTKNLAVFKNYLQKLHDLGLWPHHLERYFDDYEKKYYCRFLKDFINGEQDLLNSDAEYAKVLIDGDQFKRIDFDKIPKIKLREEYPYALISKTEELARNGSNLFHIQEARSLYGLGLHLLLQCDFHSGGCYQTVLEMLKDTNRPYVVIKLYHQLVSAFPGVIPYLIAELKTLPLAFSALEQINYRNDFMPLSFVSEERQEEVDKWRAELRGLMLSHTLICFDRCRNDHAEVAMGSFCILDMLLRHAFSRNLDNSTNIKRHKLYLKEYERFFEVFANRKIPAGGQVYQSPFGTEVLEQIYLLATKQQVSQRSEWVEINVVQLHHAVQLLKVISSRKASVPAQDEERTTLASLEKNIINHIVNLFEYYFTTTEVKVSPTSGGIEYVLPAKRGLPNPYLDIIDWGFVFLLLTRDGKLDLVTDFATSSRHVLANDGIELYSEEVSDLSAKLRAYLRILMLSLISIYEQQQAYKMKYFPVELAISKLEAVICNLSKRFSTNNIADRRVDIFDDRFVLKTSYIYAESLLTLLFRCINYSRFCLNETFVSDFFEASQDLGRMLNAANELESKKMKDDLAVRIENIDVAAFIKSKYSPSIIDTLIYAVNSDVHWKKLALPIASRLEQELSKNPQLRRHYNILWFELRLVLAYKNNDYEGLENILLPDSNGLTNEQKNFVRNRKNFIIAAYKLYHLKNYDAVIAECEALVLRVPDDPDLQVLRFRAKTLKAIDTKDKNLLSNASIEWESYFGRLSDAQKNDFARLANLIALTKIHFLASVKDSENLDSIIRELPAQYKFDFEIVETVTKNYQERKLMLTALDYVDGACSYNMNNGLSIPEAIVLLKEKVASEQDIDELKAVIKNLANLAPKDIPRVIPEGVNGGRTIDEFILRELAYACNIMNEKIAGLSQNTSENRFNDLLVALLRFRFGVWGWSVEDQSRTGLSPSGKDAGEVDIFIRKSQSSLLFIEALKIENDPKGHIEKVRKNYSQAFYSYFMLIYVTDDSDTLDVVWSDYIIKVKNIDFQSEWNIGKKGEDTLAINDFYYPSNIRIGKTLVGGIVSIYHLLVKIKLPINQT